MDTDEQLSVFYAESQTLSPQASTDEKSLHGNWQRNKESLQKRLSIRRPVDDLVNNGIMMSPLKTPPCYAERMRQLERAKTTDILKQKIQHRPDAQSLVDRHILPEWPPDEIGASPQVFEMQQHLRRTEIISSLNAKLIQRPGSLEMAEKGLLPLAPPMQTMLREGSISYPRVDETVSDIEELEEEAFASSSCSMAPLEPKLPAPLPPSTIVTLGAGHDVDDVMSTACATSTATTSVVSSLPASLPPSVMSQFGTSFLPAPSPAPSEASTVASSSSSGYGSSRRVRNHASGSSRSRKSGGALGTSKVGGFVFHTYCPPAKSSPYASPAPPPPPPPPPPPRPAPAPVLVQAPIPTSISDADTGDPMSDGPSPENMLQANIVRQIQQEEYLRLQESQVKQNVLMQQLVQDIRSRQEGQPETRPSVLQTPSVASSYVPVSGLASLNVQQLKEECRRYKVPRSGNKLNLIRNLEPFQQEILKKYVVSAQTSPTISPASNHVAVTLGQLSANGFCSEEQSIRHSSSAPQLNLSMTGGTPVNGVSGDVASVQTSSPASQWSQQPTTVIVLNQAGQMTLQPATVLLTQQGMVQSSQPPPPPPPPPRPPSSHTMMLHHTQPSSPSQQSSAPSVVLNDDLGDEEDRFVKKVEELERMIVQNIQESDAFKASHNGAKAEYLESQRQHLMANYTSTKRQAKLILMERSNEARQHLIKLCEGEASLKASGDLGALEALERERELVLQKYNRLANALNKINANATPNTSVSSETRVRSFTDSVMGLQPATAPILRSMTISDAEPSRTYSNGSVGDGMNLSNPAVKRLPSVEFQMLNEVISEDHMSAHKPPSVVTNGGTLHEAPISDVTFWLNPPITTVGQTLTQGHTVIAAAPQSSQAQPMQQQHHQLQPQPQAAVAPAEMVPVSPLQMDFSSRCSTPQRSGLPGVPGEPEAVDSQAQFNFDFLFNPNMDIAFPSMGGHQSAASMTEPILTPNTQNTLYQLIQTEVVNMETDNDSVFVP